VSSLSYLLKRMERDIAKTERAANAPPRPEGFEDGSYSLRVVLSSVSKPPVWRRVRVPSDIKFGKLHRALQAAFGWSDGHLHEWRAQVNVGFSANPFFGKMGSEGNISDSRILFQAVLLEGAKFQYVYDHGQSWTHSVEVEKIDGPGDAADRIECLDGKGACPPDDCGGPSGYRSIKEILLQPAHPDYNRLIDWLGTPSFDPSAFSLEEANSRLARLR
jgi:hypothetical protein